MPEQRLNTRIPDDKIAGTFADFVNVWHTKDIFVLDFASLDQPPHVDEATGDLHIDVTVVARVKIPPDQVFEIMKVLNQRLAAWEQQTGKRKSPEQPPAVPSE